MAKVKAVLSSIWEVVQVEGEDGMMKMMSMDEGGTGAEAEASDIHEPSDSQPKRGKLVFPTKERS